MPEQSAAIELSSPPEIVLRVVNPLLRRAMQVPGLAALTKDYMTVSFTGRKSGRRFAVPVSAHQLDGTLYVLLSAGWKHNFRDGAPVEVLHAGKTTSMHGQLIKDPAIVAQLATRAATSYGPKRSQRLMGLKFRDNRTPTVEEFIEAANRLGLAAIKLTPA
jgi:hypothetical protein